MNYHEVTTQIIELLKKHNVWFETFEHEAVRTSEEAAKISDGYTIGQGAKTLIVKVRISDSSCKFVMLVIPGDMRFDAHKVKQSLSAKSVRFATEEEVFELTNGVQLGGVAPFGSLFGLEVIVDPTLLQNGRIVFNAGDRRFSVGMKSADYQMIVSPVVKDIV